MALVRARDSWLNQLRKSFAIRTYIRRLPAHLRSDYGFSRFYTEAQIRQSVKRHGLNQRFVAYAAVLFATDPSNDDDPRRIRIDDYDLIKVELINKYFGGSDGSFSSIYDPFNSPGGDASDSAGPSSDSNGSDGGYSP